MKKLGFDLVDEIVWFKYQGDGKKTAKSYGHFFQRAKEHCLVFRKGKVDTDTQGVTGVSDVILARRRDLSQKPNELYDLVEKLCPGGKYLELFARDNNLRPGWTSVGNQVSTDGLVLRDAA